MSSYRSVSCSVTGYRKLSDGLPCEDSFGARHFQDGSVIAVADGHGDKRCIFANVGSALATRAACSVLGRHLKSAGGRPSEYWNGHRAQISRELVQAFAVSVIEDHIKRCAENLTLTEGEELIAHIKGYFDSTTERYTPDRIRELYRVRKQRDERLGRILYLYGTTLRASVLTDTYIFSCALGDGDSMIVDGGRVEWLLPKEEAYSCETASLCEPLDRSSEEFMFSYVELCEHPSFDRVTVASPTVILSTDGLRNSFFSQRLFEEKLAELAVAFEAMPRQSFQSALTRLYGRLTRESVFQDDITTVIAGTAEARRYNNKKEEESN